MKTVKTETHPEGAPQGTLNAIKRTALLHGITPIMFDRYAGDNSTQLEPHQKMYYLEDGRTICIPSENIVSFLSSENTTSSAKRLHIKSWKDIAHACLSYVSVEPFKIPLTRDRKPLVFGAFNNDGVDPNTGAFIHRSVARLKNGIPNPKVRPVVPIPWELSFTVTLYPNNEIKEEMLLKLFKDGGIALGLGTFRGVFGKFEVAAWE